MAKKSGKAKKIIKKKSGDDVTTIKHEGETFTVTPQPEPEVKSESASVKDAPKKKGGEKPKIGTKANPRKFSTYGGEFLFEDVPEGYSEIFCVEYMEKPLGRSKPRWQQYGDEYKSAKAAKAAAKEARRYDVGRHQDSLEREWHRDNMHNQQSKQILQIGVTKNTTKKAVEQFVQQIEEAKKKLEENPPVKKPDFSKEEPEYPKYRVRRRLFKVEDEIVEVIN